MYCKTSSFIISLFFLTFLVKGQENKISNTWIQYQRIDTKERHRLPTSGIGGILEVKDSTVNFIRDSIIFSTKKNGNRVIFNDSISAIIYCKNSDSLILDFGSYRVSYRPLIKFESSIDPVKLVNEIKTQTWLFKSDEFNFLWYPNSLTSEIIPSGWKLYEILLNSHQVEKISIKEIHYNGFVGLFQFDLRSDFTTFQFLKYFGDTIYCEVYRHGDIVKGQFIKLDKIADYDIAEIECQLKEKNWHSIDIVDEKFYDSGYIQLVGKYSTSLKESHILKGRVSIKFLEPNIYIYKDGNKVLAQGNWKVTQDGNYVLLRTSPNFYEYDFIEIKHTTNRKIHLIKAGNIRYSKNLILDGKFYFGQ